MKENELSKQIKNLRIKKGYSQEELSEKSGLSLRTIQRIEKGENEPRGDSLKRLSTAFNVSPDDLLNRQLNEDNNILVIMSVSQLAFLPFPILGIILPLILWLLNKDKVKGADVLGKKILNFQVTWGIVFFSYYSLFVIAKWFHLPGFSIFSAGIIISSLYLYNIIFITINSIRIYKMKVVRFLPVLNILR